jgi:hypothetical protein
MIHELVPVPKIPPDMEKLINTDEILVWQQQEKREQLLVRK